MQTGRGGLGISKHRQANVHKVAKSRYVYEFAAKLINQERAEQARRLGIRRALHESSVIAVVEKFRPR